jgi:hypothetical protein
MQVGRRSAPCTNAFASGEVSFRVNRGSGQSPRLKMIRPGFNLKAAPAGRNLITTVVLTMNRSPGFSRVPRATPLLVTIS